MKLTRVLLLFLLVNQCAFAQTSSTKLTYCIDPHWAPYEFSKNGQHLGISAFYLQRIANIAGLQLTYYPTSTWQESLDAIEKGLCDLTPLLNHTPARAKTMAFSDIYFSAPNAIFAHYEQGILSSISSITSEKLGIVKGYRMSDYIRTHYPNIDKVEVNTELDGLTMVNNGELDLFVASVFGANYLILQNSLNNIRIVGITENKDQLRMGIRHEFADLLPVINDSIAKLTDQDHLQAFKLLEPIKVIAKPDHTLAWRIAGTGLLLLFVLAARHYYALKQREAFATKNMALEHLHKQLERKNKELEELAIKDHLTQLHNRVYLKEKSHECIKHKKRFHNQSCLLLIDIDDFKNFNDNYGHQVGDDVLIFLASILKNCAREIDFVGRWGGEEFIIICPQTSLPESLTLANRLQSELEQRANEIPTAITCSIGIAELEENENFEHWFSNADKALYQAKSQGKNAIKIATDS